MKESCGFKLTFYFNYRNNDVQIPILPLECFWKLFFHPVFSISDNTEQMYKGLIWASAEDLARNRGKVLSLYRQILRSLNSPDLPLNLAARLHRKAQARAIFMLAAEERSVHNIKDLLDIAEYSLSLLRKGEIPKYIQWELDINVWFRHNKV